MSQGIMLSKEEKYELIEKIIVGYSLTTSEPADWSTNYTDYFTNTGTFRSPIYTAVTGETAPTWTSNTYYSYSSADISEISKITEPNGTVYNFQKVIITMTQPTTGGNFRGYYYVKSASTGASANIYMPPTNEYGSLDESGYKLGVQLEIKNPFYYMTIGKLGGKSAGSMANDGRSTGNTYAHELAFDDGFIYRLYLYNCTIKAGSQITIWAVRT